MRNIFMLRRCATAVLVAAAWGAAAQAEPQTSPGAALFREKSCFACHGLAGQGGAGPGLAPGVVPFPAFLAFVRTPPADMPPFGPRALSDADARRIHEFLSGVRAGLPAGSIPALRREP
ncbi:MAG: c-type cytochrome [Phenylobacterium sp.]